MYNKTFNVGFPYFEKANHQHIIHSAGESHINLLTEIQKSDRILIKARLNSAQNIMEFIMLSDAITRKSRLVDAFIPYMPYSRADRVVGNGGGDNFGIQQFAAQLRLFFQKITTLDIHSMNSLLELECQTGAVVENIIPYTSFVTRLIQQYNLKDICLVSPDAGSYDKVKFASEKMGIPLYSLEKKRDQTQKGLITSFSPVTKFPENIKNAIILDDICDGGATFLQAASCIPSYCNLYLAITHGIFSKGLPLFWNAGFKAIITTDSFPQHKNNFNDLVVLGVDSCL